MPRGRRVREPVQVYLDPEDRELLEEVSTQTGLSRAEVLRRGLRTFAERSLGDRAPGWSLGTLIGALGNTRQVPKDLAAKHDNYLYGGKRGRAAAD
jgi:hypothetical protein